MLTVEDHVIFWSYQPSPLPFYAAADVGIACSIEDSLPNCLIETQAIKLSVIALTLKGLKEEAFIDKQSEFLVNIDSIKELPKLCSMMIDDPIKRKASGI